MFGEVSVYSDIEGVKGIKVEGGMVPVVRIEGKEVEVERESTILDAAKRGWGDAVSAGIRGVYSVRGVCCGMSGGDDTGEDTRGERGGGDIAV